MKTHALDVAFTHKMKKGGFLRYGKAYTLCGNLVDDYRVRGFEAHDSVDCKSCRNGKKFGVRVVLLEDWLKS